MHPARQQFGQRVSVPVPQGQEGPLALKRSHIVAIAAVSFVAVAGGFAATGSGSATQGVETSAADASTAAAGSQQPTSSRTWWIIPIPSFGRSPAMTPASTAQASVQRGGFGDTSRMMSSSTTRSVAGG